MRSAFEALSRLEGLPRGDAELPVSGQPTQATSGPASTTRVRAIPESIRVFASALVAVMGRGDALRVISSEATAPYGRDRRISAIDRAIVRAKGAMLGAQFRALDDAMKAALAAPPWGRSASDLQASLEDLIDALQPEELSAWAARREAVSSKVRTCPAFELPAATPDEDPSVYHERLLTHLKDYRRVVDQWEEGVSIDVARAARTHEVLAQAALAIQAAYQSAIDRREDLAAESAVAEFETSGQWATDYVVASTIAARRQDLARRILQSECSWQARVREDAADPWMAAVGAFGGTLPEGIVEGLSDEKIAIALNRLGSWEGGKEKIADAARRRGHFYIWTLGGRGAYMLEGGQGMCVWPDRAGVELPQGWVTTTPCPTGWVAPSPADSYGRRSERGGRWHDSDTWATLQRVLGRGGTVGVGIDVSRVIEQWGRHPTAGYGRFRFTAPHCHSFQITADNRLVRELDDLAELVKRQVELPASAMWISATLTTESTWRLRAGCGRAGALVAFVGEETHSRRGWYGQMYGIRQSSAPAWGARGTSNGGGHRGSLVVGLVQHGTPLLLDDGRGIRMTPEGTVESVPGLGTGTPGTGWSL